jgi:Spy/CpxP family protein refolding chaperone
VTRGLVLALAALSSAAVAQPPGREGGPPPQGRPRDEVFKMVDAYLISNLQESLGLSDEQFVKLLPLVKRLQTERRALVQKRIQTLMAMRRLVGGGAVNDARVTELMKELRALETEEPVIVRRHMDAIDAELTPVQQAKFRILEVEVERRIRELSAQIRRQNRPKEPGVPQAEPPLP